MNNENPNLNQANHLCLENFFDEVKVDYLEEKKSVLLKIKDKSMINVNFEKVSLTSCKNLIIIKIEFNDFKGKSHSFKYDLGFEIEIKDYVIEVKENTLKIIMIMCNFVDFSKNQVIGRKIYKTKFLNFLTYCKNRISSKVLEQSAIIHYNIKLKEKALGSFLQNYLEKVTFIYYKSLFIKRVTKIKYKDFFIRMKSEKSNNDRIISAKMKVFFQKMRLIKKRKNFIKCLKKNYELVAEKYYKSKVYEKIFRSFLLLQDIGIKRRSKYYRFNIFNYQFISILIFRMFDYTFISNLHLNNEKSKLNISFKTKFYRSQIEDLKYKTFQGLLKNFQHEKLKQSENTNKFELAKSKYYSQSFIFKTQKECLRLKKEILLKSYKSKFMNFKMKLFFQKCTGKMKFETNRTSTLGNFRKKYAIKKLFENKIHRQKIRNGKEIFHKKISNLSMKYFIKKIIRLIKIRKNGIKLDQMLSFNHKKKLIKRFMKFIIGNKIKKNYIKYVKKSKIKTMKDFFNEKKRIELHTTQHLLFCQKIYFQVLKTKQVNYKIMVKNNILLKNFHIFKENIITLQRIKSKNKKFISILKKFIFQKFRQNILKTKRSNLQINVLNKRIYILKEKIFQILKINQHKKLNQKKLLLLNRFYFKIFIKKALSKSKSNKLHNKLQIVKIFTILKNNYLKEKYINLYCDQIQSNDDHKFLEYI